jgi:hypothetical protein
MRKLFMLFAAAVLALGLSAQAGAATLTLTSGSTLGLGIGALPPVPFVAGSNTQINVSSGDGAFTLPPNVFQGTVALPTQLFTAVSLISGLTIALNGHAAIPLAQGNAGGSNVGINRAGGGLGGQGSIDGTAIVNVLFLFNLDVPLNAVGANGGFVTAASGGIAITAYGTGWTTGVVQLTGITTDTPGTLAVNTVTYAGFDDRTAGHNGQVQIISPFRAVTNVAGNLPGIAVMTLNFIGGNGGTPVPEPGTLLLLGSGVAGLIALGRRRMRK